MDEAVTGKSGHEKMCFEWMKKSTQNTFFYL
jgi:hypothetical protein